MSQPPPEPEITNTKISGSAASHASAGAGGYRWVICALLFFATTINYIDRQILSLCKEMLDGELHWTNAQFGLANSAFQAAYGVGLLGFGWFVDRFGTKIGYAVSITAWSIAAAAYWFVGSVRGFIIMRAWVGLGESGNFPTAIKATALWFPKRERAFSTSLFNSGANVAGIIAPATIPFIAAAYGWRGAYVVAGTAGFFWLIAWWLFYDLPEKHKRVSKEELDHILSDREGALAQQKLPWSSLLGYRQTWSFIVAKFLTDPVWWFFLIWLPDYFKKTRGLDVKHSWLHLVTIYVIITVLSIFGGWLTGYFVKCGWSIVKARKVGMLIPAISVLPVLLVTKADDWWAVCLIGLAGASHQAWSANLYSTASDMFPKKAIASVVGLGSMAGSVGGMLFPLFCGFILDKFEAAHNANAGYTILFAFCGCAYLVAFVLNHLLAPKFAHVEISTAGS
jgi:MFS transporter, ACS family, hexuronate transporter